MERFNLQSGLHRLSYGSSKAHDEPVTGVLCDKLNQLVMTGSSDGLIKIWTFKVGKLLSELDMKSNITKMIMNREK